MKRRWAYYSVPVLAAAGFVFAATAAQQGNNNQSGMRAGTMQGHMGMMQGGMMQGHMGMNNSGMGGMRGMMMAGLEKPMGRSATMAFLLPEMNSELGFSSSQTAELKTLKQQLTNQERKTTDQIAALRRDLNAQFNSGKPNESQVKKYVNQIAELQAQRLLDTYKTSTKMQAVLSPEQRSKVEKMGPAELSNAVMSRMTMNQMGQMMHYMYGAAGNGMMSGGMMSSDMTGCGMMGMMGGMRSGTMGNRTMNGQTAPQRP